MDSLWESEISGNRQKVTQVRKIGYRRGYLLSAKNHKSLPGIGHLVRPKYHKNQSYFFGLGANPILRA